ERNRGDAAGYDGHFPSDEAGGRTAGGIDLEMNISVSAMERSVRAADLPLDRLAASTQVPEQEKIAEVSRQFESMLLRQILSQAQKPLFTSTLMDESNTQGIYRDMVVQQLADRISEGGS